MVADDWVTRCLHKRCMNLLNSVSAKTRHCMTYLDDLPVQIQHLRSFLDETDPNVVYASCVTAMPTKF